MKELINHFVFDTVSLQIVALILLGFWIQARRLGGNAWAVCADWTDVPAHIAKEAAILAVALFVLISGVSLYYGAPWLMVGKVALWALHVGLIAFVRWYFVKRHGVRSFLEEAARFEALASLGILFLKH